MSISIPIGMLRCVNITAGTTPVGGKVFLREGGTDGAGTLANMSAVVETGMTWPLNGNIQPCVENVHREL